ncbi:MAG: acetyltransferase, GNAT family [uncultured bacterium]|nr:MAG: acetyltransferase, GNAT family [uncultured bacterium]
MKKMKIVYLADHPKYRKTIGTWLKEEWGERYPERNLTNWSEEQTYLGKAVLPLTLVGIDEKTGEALGTVCLRQDGMTTHKEWNAWLSYLVVPKTQRGKGYGKALLQGALKVAEELKLPELHLFTRLPDPRLYQSVGFTVCGKETYRSGEVTVMGKTIAHQARPLSTRAWQFFKAHPILTTAATVAAAVVAAYVADQMRVGRP